MEKMKSNVNPSSLQDTGETCLKSTKNLESWNNMTDYWKASDLTKTEQSDLKRSCPTDCDR